MREKMVELHARKEGSFSGEGCFGFVAAMLMAGYRYEAMTTKERDLFSHLCTKNWAYLVNEQPLAKEQATSQQINEKDMLEGCKAQMKRYIPRAGDPCFLALKRVSTVKGQPDKMCLQDGETEFTCSTFFPDLDKDFLFYLGLAGSAINPGLIVEYEHPGRTTRISAAKLIELVLSPTQNSIDSVNNKNPKWQRHEMVMCAAFMTACNSGLLKGQSLEALITHFVAELLECDEYVKLKELETVAWKPPGNCEWRARFLLPYDTHLPQDVVELLGVAVATRPGNAQGFDAGVLSSKQKIDVLLEAKSTTQDSAGVSSAIQMALKRQDSSAKVGFVVVDTTLEGVELFNLNKINATNRNMKVGRTFLEGGLLSNSRFFRLRIAGNKKVVAEAMDNKTSGSAKRVIFVISREDINNDIKEK